MNTLQRFTPTHSEVQAGLWEDGDYREVRGLNQAFRTKGELRAQGYAFAMRYGSEALAKAMEWLDFPALRGLFKVISTGPLGLRDALDAAFAVLDTLGKAITDEQTTVLQEHAEGWFGPAHEVRRMLLALRATPPRGGA